MQSNKDIAIDSMLVLRARSGHAPSLALLTRRWQKRLYLQARRLIQDQDAASDITQETWLAAVRSLHRLDDPHRFRAWIYSILRKKAADAIRQRERDRALQAQPPHPAVSQSPTVESEAPITAALRTLPFDEQHLLTLRHIEALSIAELARVFNAPPGTIKSRLHTARQHLRHALEPNTERNDP